MFWGRRLGSIALAVAGCYLLQVASGGLNDFVKLLLIYGGIYVTLAVSLNLINGITGQFSIGHAAFYMIGAYTAGVLARSFYAKAHLPPTLWLVVVILAGALLAGIAGFIVGLPSLRLKGDYLAIVTMGFGEIINIVARNQDALGKAYGMSIEPRIPSVFMVWLLAIVCIAVCRNLLKNVHGLSFLAVREDEVASSAMGVDITRVKVIAFVLGSAFAGAAGALFAHGIAFIGPTLFGMDVSFVILTMVVLGGTGSITGSTIAAVVLAYIPEWMRELKTIPMSGLVAALIVTVFAVAVIKKTIDGHKDKGVKAGIVVGTIVGAVLVSFGLGLILKGVPAFAVTIEGSKLRYVVFAGVLVILMLLRPQGVFAHHEFSWSWVKKLLGKKDVPTTAVSA